MYMLSNWCTKIEKFAGSGVNQFGFRNAQVCSSPLFVHVETRLYAENRGPCEASLLLEFTRGAAIDWRKITLRVCTLVTNVFKGPWRQVSREEPRGRSRKGKTRFLWRCLGLT